MKKEESITADSEVDDPISEETKKTLLRRALKRMLSMRNLKGPKDNAINEDLQELQEPQ